MFTIQLICRKPSLFLQYCSKVLGINLGTSEKENCLKKKENPLQLKLLLMSLHAQVPDRPEDVFNRTWSITLLLYLQLSIAARIQQNSGYIQNEHNYENKLTKPSINVWISGFCFLFLSLNTLDLTPASLIFAKVEYYMSNKSFLIAASL